MNPLFLMPLLEMGKGLIDKFIPDPQEKAKAELELFKSTQEGELKTILAQLEINAREAQSSSIFVAGWRPFVGWTSGLGFFYATVIHNILAWVATIRAWPAPPAVDTETLIYVLFALLGIGGMRSLEKIKKVAK